MANLKASKKHNRQTKSRTEYNDRIRNRLKKATKAFEKFIASGDSKRAKVDLPKVTKIIDKAVAKNVLNSGTGSRRISRLTKKLNNLITASKNVKTAKKGS